MLEGVRKALTRLAGSIREKLETREVSEEDVREALEGVKYELIDANVAYDVVERLADELVRRASGTRMPRGRSIEDYVRELLASSLISLFSTGATDLAEAAASKCAKGYPYVVVFFGVNGVGKTTTIAKVAYLLKKRGISSVMVAADTFRAGAQEQLRRHAEAVGVPFVGSSYGADPASVAYDAIQFARSRGLCAVLIDTAGRMHVDKDLMDELRKVVRVSKPDMKVLVVDALTGNDAVEQARQFNEGVGIDGIIVTKVDADEKGGVLVSVSAVTGKPILYIGTGQKYEDLERLKPEEFVKGLLS